MPAGTYQLNFVGNGIIANGRAVDVANNGTQIGGFLEFEFTVAAPGLPGDYNQNNSVDAADYVLWRKTINTPAAYDTWRANFGNSNGAGSDSLAQTAATLGTPAAMPAATDSVVKLAVNQESKDEQRGLVRRDTESNLLSPRSVAGRRSGGSQPLGSAIAHEVAERALLAWLRSAPADEHLDQLSASGRAAAPTNWQRTTTGRPWRLPICMEQH